MLEQVVQDDLGVVVLGDLDDHPHAVAVGLVPQVGDAFDFFVPDQLGDLLDQLGFVHLVGQLGDDDALAVLLVDFHARLGLHANRAAARGIGLVDAFAAQNEAAGGEIGPLDELHQVLDGGLGVVDQVGEAVDHFAQVVGRDVGGHAHGDARWSR